MTLTIDAFTLGDVPAAVEIGVRYAPTTAIPGIPELDTDVYATYLRGRLRRPSLNFAARKDGVLVAYFSTLQDSWVHSGDKILCDTLLIVDPESGTGAAPMLISRMTNAAREVGAKHILFTGISGIMTDDLRAVLVAKGYVDSGVSAVLEV